MVYTIKLALNKNEKQKLRVCLISVFCILFSKLVLRCFEKLFIKIIF
jgi:hypothetical protein